MILTKIQAKKAEFARIGTDVAEDALKGWVKGGRCMGLTAGRFSLISLIEAVLRKTGAAKVTISTWSAGFYDTLAIDTLMKSGKVTDILWILDRSFASRKAKYSATLEALFPPEKIRTTDTHAKFVLIENEDWSVTIRTSMNLNENKKCETYEIDDDASILAFYNQYVADLKQLQPKGMIGTGTICTPVMRTLFDIPDDEKENDSSFAWNLAVQ